MKNKKVVTVTLGSSKQDFSFETDFLGQHFEVQRLGADDDTGKAWELMRRNQASADAIGLGEIGDHFQVGLSTVVNTETKRLLNVVTRVPVTTGATLAPPAAGARGAPCAEGTRQLLQQQPGAVPVGHAQLRDGGGAVGLHAQPELCRCAVPDRRAGDAGLARATGALRQGQRHDSDAPARDARVLPVRLQEHDGVERGGQVARRRRHLRRAQGGGQCRQPGRQDAHHLGGGRRAAGLLHQVQGQPGDRCLAQAVRPRGRRQHHRGHGPGHAGEEGRRSLGRRVHRDPGRTERQATAAASDRQLPQHPPLCLRRAPVEPGVHQEGLPDPQGHAQVRDGPGRDAGRAHAADGLLQDGEHRLADRGRGRGLAALRRRHAQGDARAQPRVHLPPPAACRQDRREAGRADHGPGRVHQGGRRCRRHRGAAFAHPHHHRQQLFGLRRAVGRGRRDEAHGPGAAGQGRRPHPRQDHGHRRHRARSAASARG